MVNLRSAWIESSNAGCTLKRERLAKLSLEDEVAEGCAVTPVLGTASTPVTASDAGDGREDVVVKAAVEAEGPPFEGPRRLRFWPRWLPGNLRFLDALSAPWPCPWPLFWLGGAIMFVWFSSVEWGRLIEGEGEACDDCVGMAERLSPYATVDS